MNEDQKEQARQRIRQAADQTKVQAEEAAVQLKDLFHKGLAKAKEAADAAKRAVQDDLNKRP